MKTCFSLGFLGECGFHGSCVEELDNSTNQLFEECVCKEGWSQGRDMAFYFHDEQELNERNISLCNQNEKVLKVLFWVMLLSASFAFIYQTLLISKWKHLYKASFVLLGGMLEISLSAYKLTNFKTASLGEDVLFTSLVFNCILFFSISISLFSKRYTAYIVQFTKLRKQYIVKRAHLVSNYQTVMFFLDIIVYQMFWITALLPRKAAYVAVRVLFLCLLTSAVGNTLSINFILSEVSRDLKKLLHLRSITMKNDGTVRTNNTYYKIVEKTLVRLSALRNISISYGVLFLFIRVSPAVVDEFLYNYIYFLAVDLILWNVVSIAGLNARKRKRGIRRSKEVRSVFNITGQLHRDSLDRTFNLEENNAENASENFRLDTTHSV